MYQAFDLIYADGYDLQRVNLEDRKRALASLLTGSDLMRFSDHYPESGKKLFEIAGERGLEGIVAKRADSIYEPGRRTGLLVKCRLNRRQEFVIGGYVPSHLGVDSIVIGVYRGKELYYAARVRARLVPLTRRQVFERIKLLETAKCPFENLPEKDAGRWGQRLTAEKMKECVWVKPRTVAEVEFLEWTDANHPPSHKVRGPA